MRGPRTILDKEKSVPASILSLEAVELGPDRFQDRIAFGQRAERALARLRPDDEPDPAPGRRAL